MKYFLIFIILVVSSLSAQATMPACKAEHGGYCYYSGKVERLYINSGGLILLYFDTVMPPENAAIAGFSITNGTAAAFKMSDYPDFAKTFYSTALAAQASGKNVVIQMRGNESGYLKFDRIWLDD